MRILSLLPVCLLVSYSLAVGAPAGEAQAPVVAPVSSEGCEHLASLKLPDASITSAKAVAAGTFDGPPQAFTGADLSAFYKRLPAFCRIVAKATPTADSNIGIEVWMPLSGWNGKLEGVGNGGFAGLIDDFQLGAGIARGYAAAATDAGHTGSPADASWALGHPEKIIDFGYRGVHEMSRVAKLVVQQFYGSGPKRSYFDGCSDGGREALMEAQRYPDDYDGILAGAPANNWTGLQSLAVANTQALTADAASYIPSAKIPTIASAVLAACDKLDGVADGILNDPRECHFDPMSIACKSGEDNASCLTAAQAATLAKIYAGLQDSRGHTIFPGYQPGAEDGAGGWGLWITGPAPGQSAIAVLGKAYFSNMVYEKRDWDYKSFTVDSGIQAAKEKTAAALDAVNADLTPFRSRGGKLILYHGWNDPAIPALSTINYYDEVIARMGRTNADSFVRLYMIPGMQHCGGGPGPGLQLNARIALENWVENGIAPSTIIATRGAASATSSPRISRPLCPYPQAAKYKGSGDPNSADNFACANPQN